MFVHGHNNNREENGDYLNISERLVVAGYSVLLFDLRGHGRSEGDRVSYGYFERNDLSAAIDFLEARGIPPERVGVLGFSMGAGTALLGAVQEPRVRALVADSTYARASDLIVNEIDQQTDIPEWLAPVFVPGARLLAELLFDVDIGELVPENAARDLDYPILVIHGEADSRIPSSHGERVHGAAHPASQLWLLPGIEHTDAFPTYPDQYMEWVTTYLDSQLGGK